MGYEGDVHPRYDYEQGPIVEPTIEDYKKWYGGNGTWGYTGTSGQSGTSGLSGQSRMPRPTSPCRPLPKKLTEKQFNKKYSEKKSFSQRIKAIFKSIEL